MRYFLVVALLALSAGYVLAQVGGGGVSSGPFAYPRILVPGAFSVLPACAAAYEGAFASVTDSNTVTWGATVAGSSTNHVLAYCDGTNWTVAAK